MLFSGRIPTTNTCTSQFGNLCEENKKETRSLVVVVVVVVAAAVVIEEVITFYTAEGRT